jgi:dUTP pyrophosphatase
MSKTRGFEVVRDDARKFANKEIKLPTRGSSKAAAYDFYANDSYTVEPNKIVKVWTDVKSYMGDDEVLLLDVRSSMGGKFMLANTIGVVDSDYYSNENNDGNIGIFLKNISDKTLNINEGDRVAQGMFFTYLVADNGNTDEVRTGGFGSSGK